MQYRFGRRVCKRDPSMSQSQLRLTGRGQDSLRGPPPLFHMHITIHVLPFDTFVRYVLRLFSLHTCRSLLRQLAT
jgi:hypothetical protein